MGPEERYTKAAKCQVDLRRSYKHTLVYADKGMAFLAHLKQYEQKELRTIFCRDEAARNILAIQAR